MNVIWSSERLLPGNRTIRRWMALSPVVLASFLLLISYGVCADKEEEGGDPVETELYNDMMYGADDIFGEHSDVSYSESAVQADQNAKKSAPQQTVQPSSSQSSGSRRRPSAPAPVAAPPPPPPDVPPPPPPPDGP